MYTITLANGNVLNDLELNGNNFISDTVLADNIFEGGLGTVQISDGENIEVHTDMKLICNRVIGGKSWFVLADKTEQEKQTEALYATLAANASSITDVQMALAELSILIAGGLA